LFQRSNLFVNHLNREESELSSIHYILSFGNGYIRYIQNEADKVILDKASQDDLQSKNSKSLIAYCLCGKKKELRYFVTPLFSVARGGNDPPTS
jgi:hypothetical protein